jgi:hypothetical protein
MLLSLAITAGAVMIHEADDTDAAYFNGTRYVQEGVGTTLDISASKHIVNGHIPPGMSFVIENISGVNFGFIKGTPTTPGVYTITLAVYDSGLDTTDYTYTVNVLEKVTYHQANGSVTTKHNSTTAPNYAPGGTPTSGNTFCGWNTKADGTGITYLANSAVPAGTKELWAQQSTSPLTISFKHINGTTVTSGVISGQKVMMPTVMPTSTPAYTSASIGFNTSSDGTGTMYLIAEPAVFTASQTLYSQAAKLDSSRTVVVVGTTAYYITRGETFNFTFTGVPYRVNYYEYPAPCASSGNVVYEGYTMAADTNLISVNVGWYATSITFFPNGGTGSMKNIIAGAVAYDNFLNTKAPDCAFTAPAGKMFKAWRMGSPAGPALSPGGTINGTGENVDLYAEWMDIPPDPVWIISYDANGGTGSIAPTTVVRGNNYNITSLTFTPPNQRAFIGWSVMGDGTGTLYNAGAQITPTDDTTIVAVWKWDYFYINLIPNGAPGSTESIQSPGDVPYILPESPFTWEGYTFVGWMINNAEPQLAVGYSLTPYGNVNLYAQWIEDGNGGGGEGGGLWGLLKGLSAEMWMIILILILVVVMFAWTVIRDD